MYPREILGVVVDAGYQRDLGEINRGTSRIHVRRRTTLMTAVGPCGPPAGSQGELLLMSEVPMHRGTSLIRNRPPHCEPPQDPRHRPEVGS